MLRTHRARTLTALNHTRIDQEQIPGAVYGEFRADIIAEGVRNAETHDALGFAEAQRDAALPAPNRHRGD